MNLEEIQKRDKRLIDGLRKEKCAKCDKPMPDDLYNMVIYKADNIPGKALHYCSVDCYSSHEVDSKCNICNKTAHVFILVPGGLAPGETQEARNLLVNEESESHKWPSRPYEVCYRTFQYGVVMAKANCGPKCAKITTDKMNSLPGHQVLYPLCKLCAASRETIPPIISEDKSKPEIVNTETSLKICGGCKRAKNAIPAWYCGIDCQKEHWASHKNYCGQ